MKGCDSTSFYTTWESEGGVSIWAPATCLRARHSNHTMTPLADESEQECAVDASHSASDAAQGDGVFAESFR